MGMRRALPVLILALALGLAACGGDDDDGGGGGSGAVGSGCPSGAVTIAMKDIKFVPEQATAKVGQEICWRNDDTVDHDAVAESGADFKSDLFGNGETFTATVDKAGTVEYVCTVHPSMTGKLEITP
jgi:plastocyanin